MYTGLLATHSYMRYIIVLMLVIVIVLAIVGLINKGPFTRKHDKTSLFLLICAHTQFLLGLILYIVSAANGYRVQFNSSTMKDPALRYFAVEHAVAMLITVALITIGRVSTKKTPVDQTKHRRTLVYNLIALILIFVVVFSMGGKYNVY